MALAADLRVKVAGNRLFSEAVKIRCATRLQALDSMHESASYSDHSMRPALCIRAPGSSAGSFLFWQRLLSMVRRLLRWSGLRLLSELLRLRRLLSAFLAASILRRVLWRLARARLGSWTGRGSWTRRWLARSSLIPSNRCQMPLALQGQRALSRSLAPACLLAKKIPNRFRCRFLERFGIETLRKNFAMSQTCLASRCIVKLISVGIASGRHLMLDFNDRLQIVSSQD